MSDTDWIKELKQGDKVICCSHYTRTVGEVEKVTASGLIKINGVYFNSDGSARGRYDYWRPYIEQATPESVEQIKQKLIIADAFRAIQAVQKLTYSQAVRILEILNEKEQPKE